MPLRFLLLLVANLLLFGCAPKEESARDGLLPPEPLQEIDVRAEIRPEVRLVTKTQLDAASQLEQAGPERQSRVESENRHAAAHRKHQKLSD